MFMKYLPKEFVWRTARAILFIFLVVLICTAVSGGGLYLASRFSLTRSKDQVPLSALSIGAEGPVSLPRRGELVQGNGWKLRNSRDVYTLTLDNASIDGSGVQGKNQPGITVSGDLILELKAGSHNVVRSDGVGILAGSGTLVIRGEGKLEIQAGGIGVDGDNVELSGKDNLIEADNGDGIGIRAASLTIGKSVGQVVVRGNSGAIIVARPEPGPPVLRVMDGVQTDPPGLGIKEFKSTSNGRNASDQTGETFNVKTFSSEKSVAYDEETDCFQGAAREIMFTGK